MAALDGARGEPSLPGNTPGSVQVWPLSEAQAHPVTWLEPADVVGR